MKSTSETILFFGSGPVAAASLRALCESFSIEAVVTKATPSHHRGHVPVEAYARSKDIPIRYANSRVELDGLIHSARFQSRVGVIVDYGIIVSHSVISSFELGIINSHFSLLPEWRGADPITFSILSGQVRTGVSLMLIEPSLDTGKLITQESLDIHPTETTPTLTSRLITLSNAMLRKYIPLYLQGTLLPYSQLHTETATYSRKLTKQDGLIDISKPAAQLEREIRAYCGWPSSYMCIQDKRIIITKAHVLPHTDGLSIACGDGRYLVIDELIAPSGKRMDGKSFLNGLRDNH